MNYGEAIQAMNQGRPVARKGWNSKGLIVFKQVQAIIRSVDICNLKSVPDEVKDVIVEKGGRFKV